MQRDADGEALKGEGEPSRFQSGRADSSFVKLRPERVLEVRYDQLEGWRFRHTVQFERWRPDRDPRSCTYEQLEVVAASTWPTSWSEALTEERAGCRGCGIRSPHRSPARRDQPAARSARAGRGPVRANSAGVRCGQVTVDGGLMARHHRSQPHGLPRRAQCAGLWRALRSRACWWPRAVRRPRRAR